MNLIQMFSAYSEEKGFGPRIHYAEGVGFATYHLLGEGKCYLEEIYVVPEKRKTGEGRKIADTVCEIAKESGRNILIGSVNQQAKTKDDSMKAFLAYGMKLEQNEGDMVYLKKEI